MSRIAIQIREIRESYVCASCGQCGFIRPNRIAGDDNEVMLSAIAARPIGRVPFPVESFATIRG